MMHISHPKDMNPILKVISIAPEAEWDLSRKNSKAVILENGRKVLVAPHIIPGDKVMVHHRTGEYLYQVRTPKSQAGWPWFVRKTKVKIRAFLDFLITWFMFPQLGGKLYKTLGIEGEINIIESAFLMMAATENLPEGDIVEIGSFKGRSTICLAFGNAQPQTKIAAIDPHYTGSYRDFIANINKFGVQNSIDTLQTTSEIATKNWAKPIRILWIDGYHEYESVRNDIVLWETHLKAGGLILLHDSDRPGVTRAIDEFIRPGNYSSIGRISGITFAIKGQTKSLRFLEKFNRIEKQRNKLTALASKIGLGVKRSAILARELASKR